MICQGQFMNLPTGDQYVFKSSHDYQDLEL